MVIYYFLAFLLFNTLVFAQYTVAPSGSGSESSPPPVGESESTGCQFGNCSIELKLRPFCFGANLRSYPVGGQLKDDNKNVNIRMTFTSSTESTQRDVISVSFPPSLTFNKKDIRRVCMFTTPNGSVGQKRDMNCPNGKPNESVLYTLVTGWKSAQNPYSHGGLESSVYAGQILDATTNSGATPKDIRCLYRYTQDGRNGVVINDSVSCYFPNPEDDKHALVTVKNAAGADISVSEKSAFTNDIRIVLTNRLNSLPATVPVVHGEVKVGSPPSQTLEFFQNGAALYNTIKKNEFNKATAYQSYSLEVGFPGEQGFCGGFYSPLMFFFDDQRPSFSGITNFPLYGKNPGAANYWPEKNAPGFFLVHLKKNQKQVLDHENLFGKTDNFQNGFEALKAHDSNADNVIDHKDPIFKELKLWNDKNADGFSSNKELFSLKDKGVTKISLNYSVNNGESFDDKARAREKGSFTYKLGKKIKEGEVLDVWFNSLD